MQDQITAAVHASRIRVVGAASIDINLPPRKRCIAGAWSRTSLLQLAVMTNRPLDAFRTDELRQPDRRLFQLSTPRSSHPDVRLPVNPADCQHAPVPLKLWIHAPYQTLAFQDGHDVIAVLPLGCGRENLEAVVEAEPPPRPTTGSKGRSSGSSARRGCDTAPANGQSLPAGRHQAGWRGSGGGPVRRR